MVCTLSLVEQTQRPPSSTSFDIAQLKPTSIGTTTEFYATDCARRSAKSSANGVYYVPRRRALTSGLLRNPIIQIIGRFLSPGFGTKEVYPIWYIWPMARCAISRRSRITFGRRLVDFGAQLVLIIIRHEPLKMSRRAQRVSAGLPYSLSLCASYLSYFGGTIWFVDKRSSYCALSRYQPPGCVAA